MGGSSSGFGTGGHVIARMLRMGTSSLLLYRLRSKSVTCLTARNPSRGQFPCLDSNQDLGWTWPFD